MDILELFKDDDLAQFGIHNICKQAKIPFPNYKPGDWFGPHMISVVLQKIMNEQSPI